MARYQKNLQEKKNIFDQLLVDLSAIDEDKAMEMSQQKQDGIKSVVAKYMFDFHNYGMAAQLIGELTDSVALENVKVEKEVINKLLKD